MRFLNSGTTHGKTMVPRHDAGGTDPSRHAEDIRIPRKIEDVLARRAHQSSPMVPDPTESRFSRYRSIDVSDRHCRGLARIVADGSPPMFLVAKLPLLKLRGLAHRAKNTLPRWELRSGVNSSQREVFLKERNFKSSRLATPSSMTRHQ